MASISWISVILTANLVTMSLLCLLATDLSSVSFSSTDFKVMIYRIYSKAVFRTWEVEGLYYLCSENKGADQLCDYRTADLRLCFRKGKKQVFS